MKNTLLKVWLPIVIAGTIALLATYVAVQQDMRMAANDPQIQLSEDGAAALTRGLPATNLIGNVQIDARKSMQVFGIVYDDTGKILVSSVMVGSSSPVLPAGVLEYARSHVDNRLTWEPAPGVRFAAVVRHYTGTTSGFLLVARSLREVEVREHQLGMLILYAWLALVIVTLAWVYSAKRFFLTCGCGCNCSSCMNENAAAKTCDCTGKCTCDLPAEPKEIIEKSEKPAEGIRTKKVV